MSPDLLNQTAMRWRDPDPKYVPLLREASVTVAVTTPNEGFERACRAAGIAVVEPDHRIAIVNLSIDRANGTGLVNARVILRETRP